MGSQWVRKLLEFVQLNFKHGFVWLCGLFLLGSAKHCKKGSPVYPGEQLQIGLWFNTWQRAFVPHVPGQGSLHFWLIQALS